jgi:hypothetical protein
MQVAHLVEDWVVYWENHSLNGGNEEIKTLPFSLLRPNPGGIGEPPSAIQWRAVISDADTDDVIMRVYRALEGTTESTHDSEPCQINYFDHTKASPYQASGVLTWEEIGSGCALTFQRTGSEDGITVYLAARRIRG